MYTHTLIYFHCLISDAWPLQILHIKLGQARLLLVVYENWLQILKKLARNSVRKQITIFYLSY